MIPAVISESVNPQLCRLAKASSVIPTLRRHIDTLHKGRIENIEEISEWCLSILYTAPTLDLSAWIERVPGTPVTSRPFSTTRKEH